MTKPDQRLADFEIPEQITVTLKKPLRLAASDVVLLELSFRPPTVGEMKQVTARQKAQGEEAATTLMLVVLSNDKLTAPDVDRLTFLDLQICQEKLVPFWQLTPLSEVDQA